MTSSVDKQADAIVAKLRASKVKPCFVMRHPQSDLILALIARGVSDHVIPQEIPNSPSDTSIRAHRKGTCGCPKV